MDGMARDVTLFLVEDDDVDAMTVERGFKKNRISNPIVRASDGVEAFEMLTAKALPNPFMILLDLQMPRMGGIEFLEKIRQHPELKGTVIFVLTTSKNDEDILASYSQNIAGYFLKEKSGEEFLDIINMLRGYWKIVQLPAD